MTVERKFVTTFDLHGVSLSIALFVWSFRGPIREKSDMRHGSETATHKGAEMTTNAKLLSQNFDSDKED